MVWGMVSSPTYHRWQGQSEESTFFWPSPPQCRWEGAWAAFPVSHPQRYLTLATANRVISSVLPGSTSLSAVDGNGGGQHWMSQVGRGEEVGRHLSPTYTTACQTSSGNIFPRPPPTGLTLLCCPGEVQDLLSWVLQLVGARALLPLLWPLSQFSHLSEVWWRGDYPPKSCLMADEGWG